MTAVTPPRQASTSASSSGPSELLGLVGNGELGRGGELALERAALDRVTHGLNARVPVGNVSGSLTLLTRRPKS